MSCFQVSSLITTSASFTELNQQMKTVGGIHLTEQQHAFAFQSLFYRNLPCTKREWRQILSILRQTIRQDDGL